MERQEAKGSEVEAGLGEPFISKRVASRSAAAGAGEWAGPDQARGREGRGRPARASPETSPH